MTRKQMGWLTFYLSGMLLFGFPLHADNIDFPLPPIIMLLNSSSCSDKYICLSSEICDDPGAMAIDNNCNGQVDEGCECLPGAQQACFKGDPTYRYFDGCYAGVQECTVSGQWGACKGGLHATDACYDNNVNRCGAISTRPFVPVDLKSGTGNFSNDAQWESWEVSCPDGTTPCPEVTGSNPKDDYIALTSGEYSVTYNKTTNAGPDSCTYPLFVGAPGLRVELNWEWDENLGIDTVDLDLHLHKPGNADPWGGDKGNAVDCAYDNCTASDCTAGNCPNWFTGANPPAPVGWYLDPVFENNSCYFSPKGAGEVWQLNGTGCHSPRLDIDNIYCDPTVTDPSNTAFCNAENINIDFPPLRQWTRIGVHYYSSHGQTYDVHPEVKVFCDGRLAATLGSGGYYNPQAPVTFSPGDSETRFWIVADVAFTTDSCGERRCVVEPIYLDSEERIPYLWHVDTVKHSFTPPYPALP